MKNQVNLDADTRCHFQPVPKNQGSSHPYTKINSILIHYTKIKPISTTYTKTKPNLIPTLKISHVRPAHKINLNATTHTKTKWIESRIKNKSFRPAHKNKSICLLTICPSQFRSPHENQALKSIQFRPPHKKQDNSDHHSEIKSFSMNRTEIKSISTNHTKRKASFEPALNLSIFRPAHKNEVISTTDAKTKSTDVRAYG